MGDKKKILTITLCSTLIGIPAIAGITVGIVSLNKVRKEQDKTVETITIVNDIDPLDGKEGESLASDKIEVKCFNAKKEEIQGTVKLDLYDEWFILNQKSWISIEDNQVIVKNTAEVGEHTFYVQASTNEGKVLSEFKKVLVNITQLPPPKPPVVIDKIKIDDFSNIEMFDFTSKSISLTCRAYQGDVEVTTSLPSISWSYTCVDPSLAGLIPPKVEIESTSNNTCDVAFKSYSREGEIGTYDFTITAKCIVDSKEIITSATRSVKIVSGTTYRDENNYVYTRDSLTDNWTLSIVPYGTKNIDGILTKIYGYEVTAICDDFASKNILTNSLVQVKLPSTIKKIGKYAFKECTSLTSFDFGGVERVEESAFEKCELMEQTGSIPKFNYVGDNAFYSCSKFSAVDLSECDYIGVAAFFNTGVKELTLSKELKAIYNNAFVLCDELKTVTMLATTPPTLEGGAFGGCSRLESIFVPAESYNDYCSANGWKTYSSYIKIKQ